MNIYKSNGSTLSFPINTIDSINYSNSILGVCLDTIVTDIDGNVYDVIPLGGQCWMQENLKTSHYRNGTPIPTGLNDVMWTNDSIGAYSIYDNDTMNNNVYGKLYNWYAANSGNCLCPTGWHVPTDAEWNTLAIFLDPAADTIPGGGTFIQSSFAGGSLKEAGYSHWYPPNTLATNSSGFFGLPGGYRTEYGGVSTTYVELTTSVCWMAVEFIGIHVPVRWLFYDFGDLVRIPITKHYGVSVRCIQD